jgi:metal-responsive CopG/Arc/MetJ family transcriptional regulator
MKTAISIPDKVFRSADSLARRLGISRSQLYATAISEYLSKYHGKQVTDKLNSIYTEEDSSLPGDLTALQSKSLPQTFASQKRQEMC